tara:strand:+ start:280 stop:627 length:348 start_codon:yes stop_codon:yes gene_type:complete
MTDALIKCTTRHVRIFTAIYEDEKLIEDSKHLTLDLDPDNEFLWDKKSLEKVQARFKDLVNSHAGKELTDYNLRKIGSDIESKIRQMLQAGELTYNPDSRVLNYSMGLPRSKELL